MTTKRKKIDPHKPLIEMTRKELQQTFDEIGLGNTFRMLEDARHGEGESERHLLAVAVLTTATGEEHPAYSQEEYGDADATANIQDWIAEVHRTPGLLRDGETLRLQMRRVTAWAEEPAPRRRRRW